MKDDLLSLVEAYCSATSLSEARVASLAYGSGTFFSRIRNGRTFTAVTYDRLIQWFSDNWPDNATWPESVEQPHSEPVN